MKIDKNSNFDEVASNGLEKAHQPPQFMTPRGRVKNGKPSKKKEIVGIAFGSCLTSREGAKSARNKLSKAVSLNPKRARQELKAHIEPPVAEKEKTLRDTMQLRTIQDELYEKYQRELDQMQQKYDNLISSKDKQIDQMIDNQEKH